MMNKETEWHLSKTVPVTLVVAIICQTVALVWYVSSLDNSVKNNAREILRHEVRIDTLDKVVQSQALTLARIDENIKSIRLMMEDNRRD
jgi:homoserine kinase